MGGIPDGALGAMVGGFLTNNLDLVGSLVDATRRPHQSRPWI